MVLSHVTSLVQLNELRPIFTVSVANFDSRESSLSSPDVVHNGRSLKAPFHQTPELKKLNQSQHFRMAKMRVYVNVNVNPKCC